MRRLPLVCLVGLIAACGDAIVGAGYEGEPVHTIEPLTVVLGPNDDLIHPRVAAAWIPDGVAGDPGRAVEQPGTSRPTATQQTPFHLLDLPDDALLATAPAGARYGLAVFIVYDDVDGDRAQGPDEPTVGTSRSGLIYLPRALDGAASPTGAPLPAGFHAVDLPIPCAAPETPEATCSAAANLGARCTGDDDCRGGTRCLTGVADRWPGGYCVVPATGCVPADGALAPAPGGGRGWRSQPVWLLGCAADADCRAETYVCDAVIGGCRPRAPMRVEVGDAPPTSACVELGAAPAGGVE